MRNKLLLFLLLLCTLACEQKEETAPSILDFFPPNPSLLIKINNLDAYLSETDENPLLKTANFELPDSLFHKMGALRRIQSEEKALIGTYANDSTSISLLMALKKPFSYRMRDSTSSLQRETVSIEGVRLEKIQLNTQTFYLADLESYTLLSSSPTLLKSSISRTKNNLLNGSLLKLYKTSTDSIPASVFINPSQTTWLENYIGKSDSTQGHKLRNWMSFDLNTSTDFIHLRGIALDSDSIVDSFTLFKSIRPLVSVNALSAPYNTNAFISFTVDDYDSFTANQERLLDFEKPLETIFSTVDEISILQADGNEAVLLHTYGTEEINLFLEEQRDSGTNFQGHDIFQLSQSSFLKDYFQPIITEFSPTYYTVLENTYVFSEQVSVIETIIEHKARANTFDKNPLYSSAFAVLADASNVLFIGDKIGLKSLISEFCSKQLNTDFEKLMSDEYVYAGQLVSEKGFYHTNLIAQKKIVEEKHTSTSIAMRVELESDLATDPQFVINHRNGEKEIVVQDIDNNLYLISNKGKVVWKKSLNSKIQGKISQVDLYKNGRLQLAFTTNNEFLILDRNGNEVEPFNMKFPGGNLNGLAVFDYDEKKNYRFVITQGNKVRMYNGKGKKVNGFKYTKAESQILMPPKHIKIGKKDYIVFMLENGSLKIVSRTGKIRVPVKEKIDFSENEVYKFKDNFVTTDKKGVLYAVDQKGKITKSAMGTNPDHGIVTTNKTFVLQNENILKIRGHETELELGVYSRPQLFYVNNKIYVSVSDIQSQKVYLFDSNGKTISGFPVFGNYKIDLQDIDKDKKIEIVTKEQENALIVYDVN